MWWTIGFLALVVIGGIIQVHEERTACKASKEYLKQLKKGKNND